MSDTLIEKDPRLTQPGNGEGMVAHIIRDVNKHAHARVAEAAVMGTELDALCGAKIPVTREAKGLPVCESCVAALNALK